jgi:NADH-quinone oxidoreductase subunit F
MSDATVPGPRDTTPVRVLTRNIDTSRGPNTYEGYLKSGGYESVRKLLQMAPEAVVQVVRDAKLRGRGGAGFDAGFKWSLVPQGGNTPKQKYLVVNGDEMEPATFKDRMLLSYDPHLLVEGVIGAAYAIRASVAYIFLRGEYRIPEVRLRQAIAEAYQHGWIGKNILGSGYDLDVILHTSGGRYICGEETALINALEGRRANPRAKPPFPAVSGLWGKPTIVNNVETICNVSGIINHGAQWFLGLSKSPDGGGTKLYGASGMVKNPGTWELPLGVTVREVFEGCAGGMAPGKKFKAFLPGGGSTDFLVEQHLDLMFDYTTIGKAGSRMGTGQIMVVDQDTDLVGVVHNLMRFFAQESCGWCTPCRDGLPRAEQIVAAILRGEGEPGDVETLERICFLLRPGMTFCALAPGAVEPLQSALKYFKSDFESRIQRSAAGA